MKNFILLLAVLSCLSFTFKKKKKLKQPEHYEFVPSGSYKLDGEVVSCHAMWVQDHETTNYEYRTFLNQLKKEGRMDDYKKCYPDTTAWNNYGGFMNGMVDFYFWHPSYNDYPVVNISKEAAMMYCDYLTDEFKKIYGDLVTPVRLPQKREWIYAAKGDLELSPYPWGGPYTQNAQGQYLANYRTVGDHNITTKNGEPMVVADSLYSFSSTALEAFITAPIKSYNPNGYGLFDMSGNVAEMVADEDVAMGGHWKSTGYDIRVTSQINFENANPFVGFRPVMNYLSE